MENTEFNNTKKNINFQFFPESLEEGINYISNLKSIGQLPNFTNENVSKGVSEACIQQGESPFFVSWECEGENHYAFFDTSYQLYRYYNLIENNVIHGDDNAFTPFYHRDRSDKHWNSKPRFDKWKETRINNEQVDI